MATMVLEVAGAPRRVVKLFKPLTTIGASTDNDVRVEGASLEPTHAQITRSGAAFSILGMTRDMTINGRRERSKTLEDRDVIRIGALTLTFFGRDEDAPADRPRTEPPPPGRPMSETSVSNQAYRRIHEFSMKLLQNASTDALVETILDAIVELTGADKGFLVLVGPEGELDVRAARNVAKEHVSGALEHLSDSIVRKVVESKRPLIVADALSDEEFNASSSVVNLKLLSVMCCPLVDRDTLKGVLYVGNNKLTHAFDAASLDAMSVFAAQATLLLSQQARIEEMSRSQEALEGHLKDLRLGSIVGACDSMREVFKRIRKVATADVSVLITGETGTGKELIAREIHDHSRRARGPFVIINCGAIPENLLESELFGHVRGAFTGAIQTRQGHFQAADGGTLFLDEIGELPVALQVKLLRALQEHVVTKVGGTEPESVDIRVLAATNRVLEEEIRAGRFREDLFYRLNVVNIHLPPLRDRGDDLEIIARYLLGKTAREHNPRVRGFTKSCLGALRGYRWPGNVRQLENRLKRAVVMAEGTLLTAEDMDLKPEDIEDVLPLAEARDRFQARYINQVLERNGGNRTKTARDLGVDARTIFRHLKKLSELDDPIDPETGELGLEVDPFDHDEPARP
jgi:transcriptional regulator with GAF, ATPase, and Fis domain